MKTLVIFYSRTGRTKSIAKILSEKLNCDFEEIIDKKKRSGLKGFMRGGLAARKGELTEIKPLVKNPDNYDVLLIGTPNWGSKIPPAIRTFLVENKNKLKKVAFFCTQGGEGDGTEVFDLMSNICEKNPINSLKLTTKMINDGSHHEKIAVFINQLEN